MAYSPKYTDVDDPPFDYNGSTKSFEYVEYNSETSDERSEIFAGKEKITSAVHLCKANLAYSNDELIEETRVNVSPMDALENSIHEKVKAVEDTVAAANSVADDVPNNVLQKLFEVTKIAKDENTSTFTASTSLDTTQPAYKYGRAAALNHFDLKRQSRSLLEEYDATFLSVIQSQIDCDIEKAEADMNRCFKLLRDAAKETRTDSTQLERRLEEEGKLVNMTKLDEIHSTVQEELNSEEMEYAEIERKCNKDIASIDVDLQELTKVLDSILTIHETRKSKRQQKLINNRQEQKELEERLQQLRAEEKEYIRVDREEDDMMEDAQTDHSRAEMELIDWRESIATLGKQAKASLQIVDIIKGCNDEILTDAKRRKKEWDDKLRALEMESLLSTRDVLIATICLHKMEAEDCSNNVDESKRSIETKRSEMQIAAKSRFNERVNELRRDIATYENTLKNYEERVGKHQTKIGELSDELTTINSNIKSLDPKISLISLDIVYRLRKRTKEECFDRNNVEGAKQKLSSCSSI